jgi:hypothetical protein
MDDVLELVEDTHKKRVKDINNLLEQGKIKLAINEVMDMVLEVRQAHARFAFQNIRWDENSE